MNRWLVTQSAAHFVKNPISDLVHSSPDFGLAYRSRTRHGPNRQQISAAAQFAELVHGQLWVMD
jgi:hypothetical protein